MARNLNYNVGTALSFRCDNKTVNCTTYGLLYTWAAAMDSAGLFTTNGKGCGYGKTCSPTYPVRGVCPEGWHLPTQTEWNTLFTAVGGQSAAGKVLKSLSGWNSSGNGTDSFGFSALPTGLGYSGYYIGEGGNAGFWSSTEFSSNGAYSMSLNYDYDGAYLSDLTKNYGFSVRCLQD